jgi:hypothetical protein
VADHTKGECQNGANLSILIGVTETAPMTNEQILGMSPDDFASLREFHKERLEQQITITWDKCPVPMLWLDTAIFIDMAKIETGEVREDNPRHQRLTTLRALVETKVQEGKLICPESDQLSEIEGRRLENEIRAIMTSLSSGVRSIPSTGAKDHLMQLGMRAYLENAPSMHAPLSAFFRDDPAEIVKTAQARGFVFSPNFRKPAVWLERAEENRLTIKETFEEMRQENTAAGTSFQEHYERERVGESDAMLVMLSRFYQKSIKGEASLDDVLGAFGYVALHKYWEGIGGPGPGETALYPYMRSPYYYELPPIDIASRLYADLMASGQPIKSGDNQDVQHMAFAIPVAHFVVTDRAMADRCRRRGIGEKWHTSIFSSSTLEELSEALSKL